MELLYKPSFKHTFKFNWTLFGLLKLKRLKINGNSMRMFLFLKSILLPIMFNGSYV